MKWNNIPLWLKVSLISVIILLILICLKKKFKQRQHSDQRTSLSIFKKKQRLTSFVTRTIKHKTNPWLKKIFQSLLFSGFTIWLMGFENVGFFTAVITAAGFIGLLYTWVLGKKQPFQYELKNIKSIN